jgi:hypothetical protein
MTTAAFSALQGPTGHAIAAVRNTYCKPPTFRPTAPVDGHIDCPKCGSRLNFTVTAEGHTSGRCVAAACIRWSMQ